MRGSNSTANRRYYKHSVVFTPNSAAVMDGWAEDYVEVNAYGWKDALNVANQRTYHFPDVRFITHPYNDGVATVYGEQGEILGQLTAKRVQTDG